MSIRTKKYFIKVLTNKPKDEIIINSSLEFMSAVFAIKQLYFTVLFRGQAKKEWNVESAAYRKLKKPTTEPSLSEMLNYHKNLVSNIHHLNETECNQSSDLLTLTYAKHHY